jgi:zinc transport system substrate-binding protein
LRIVTVDCTRLALSLVAATTLAACGESAAPRGPTVAEEEGPLAIYTVSYPLAWLAERIGGDRVAVAFPAPRDVDPAFWSPDGDTVAAYQDADLVLLNGAGYARWVRRAALPRSRLVDTSAGFEDRWIPVDHALTHGHGPDGEHTHGDWASATWLDPSLAALQARAIADALAKALPESESAIRERFGAVAGELETLDARLSIVAKQMGGAPILFSHPVYSYLTARYGLRARSLHWEPDQDPGESEWRALGQLLAEHPARVLLWEAAPQPQTAARLETLGVKSFVYDPCANAPDDGDFLTIAIANTEALEAAAAYIRLAPEPPPS